MLLRKDCEPAVKFVCPENFFPSGTQLPFHRDKIHTMGEQPTLYTYPQCAGCHAV